jgi:hypothetical protein
MTFVVSAICALLLLGFFSVLISPILSRRPRPASYAADHAYLELQHHKELVYAAIKELELDRAVGKTAEVDYAEQRGALEKTAVDLLRRLEESAPDNQDIIERIEHDVAALIEQRQVTQDGRPEAPYCGNCGAVRLSQHLFCPQCGTEFRI